MDNWFRLLVLLGIKKSPQGLEMDQKLDDLISEAIQKATTEGNPPEK